MRAHDGDLELLDTGTKAPLFCIILPLSLLVGKNDLRKHFRPRGSTFPSWSAFPTFREGPKKYGGRERYLCPEVQY